jgi:hypothetical protein
MNLPRDLRHFRVSDRDPDAPVFYAVALLIFLHFLGGVLMKKQRDIAILFDGRAKIVPGYPVTIGNAKNVFAAARDAQWPDLWIIVHLASGCRVNRYRATSKQQAIADAVTRIKSAGKTAYELAAQKAIERCGEKITNAYAKLERKS